MKLVDLKRTKAEKTAREKEYDGPSADEDYAYGLGIELDADALKKLGITEMPRTGAEFSGQIEAKVTAVEQSENDRGPDRRCVRLVIHHMALDKATDPDDKNDRKGLRAEIERAAYASSKD